MIRLPTFYSLPSRLFIASLLAALTSAASAAIYKCIDAQGQAAYSDHPCADARELKPPPLPLVPAVKPAPPDSAKDKKQATPPGRQQQAMRAEAGQKKTCAKLALRRRWAEQDVQQTRALPLRPNDKRLENAQRKARRADEQYRLECGNPP